jgi:hypothetical protein
MPDIQTAGKTYSENFDEIISRLNQHKQRASYGAVAGMLGVLPRGLMAGRQRSAKDSWVVVGTDRNAVGRQAIKVTNRATLEILT